MSLFSNRLSAGRIGLFDTGHLDSPVLTPQSVETKTAQAGAGAIARSDRKQGCPCFLLPPKRSGIASAPFGYSLFDLPLH